MEPQFCFLLSPAGALQLSRGLYKSAFFSQNKANVKMGKMAISTATIKAYANKQRAMNNERYSKQTQSKPISNDQSQFQTIKAKSKPNQSQFQTHKQHTLPPSREIATALRASQ
jgi:hypothetical protein